MKVKFLKGNVRKAACMLLTVTMGLSFTFGQLMLNDTPASAGVTGSKNQSATVEFSNVTGQVDLSDIQFENFSSGVLENNVGTSVYEKHTVIVTLSGDNMVESADGDSVSEFAETAEGRKAARAIASEQESFLNTLSGLGISYKLKYQYNNIANAVAIEVNTSYVSRIKGIDGVESVVLSETYNTPDTIDKSTSSERSVISDASTITNETSVYATGIYDSSAYSKQYGGKGMMVAILDTGLDYTHEAFASQPDKSTLKMTEEDIYNALEIGDFNASGDVYVSDKVPFAYDYADNDDDVYPSYSNHGTHVAGIIGGSADSYTDKDGNTATDENGKAIPFVSVAPNCQLVICKVFTDDLDSSEVGGAVTEDILAALEDCITLGVDVINMSLGTTCGFSTTDDGDAEGDMMNTVYSAVEEAGISLICAASNDYSSAYGSAFGTNLTSNPDSGTVGSPSTFSSALSVASISGKQSPYILANGSYPVFYRESSDENNVDYSFTDLVLEDLGAEKSATVTYVVVGGVGLASDYGYTITNAIKNAHSREEYVVALIKRGNNSFQDKVEIAMANGADAVIIYNNVAGEIKMTIGDIDNPVPTISITQEAGEELIRSATNRLTGTIEINREYLAGPFMSDFSSWGATPDLKLKPEITAHGGEITSSVPGGWAEMSGTSMATPNVAGLTANVRSYIEQNSGKFFDGEPTAKQITQLTNQLMMSTATIVVDQEALAYSPRKQGAGLASLDNIINTSAYLYTRSDEIISSPHGDYPGADDDRPKIELGDDANKTGVYSMKFYVRNVSSEALVFKANTYLMTESVSLDGLSVGEQAYMLTGESVWTVQGVSGTLSDGDTITVPANSSLAIEVGITLSDEDKAYIDGHFENGMYIEGFLQLASDSAQCSLSLPFLGFYGDWESAPMLDYDAFEIAAIEQDTSLTDEEKPKASVWATQAYSTYWNDQYVLPMGNFVYTQDDDDEVQQIYTTEEHSAISRYNDYSGLDENNYMTSSGIKGLYAGLLRNARKVDCVLTDAETGEVIYDKTVYRVNKAYSGGGSTTPGFVKMELTPDELGLVENGKYTLSYQFFFTEDSIATEENSFEFSFYVDYSAPVLEDARIRYYDYKDSNNRDQQRIYLDLDVYDNHYSMAALLCRYTTDAAGEQALQLATEYVTPIYNANKNGTTTVSIEITDLLEEYGAELYVEFDDYALNHSVYKIDISDADSSQLPDTFELADGEDSITIDKLSTHKVSLVWDKTTYSGANLSNFTWAVTSGTSNVAVKNGEIVGLKAGSATVTVSNGTVTRSIRVTVNDSDKTLSTPSISFGTIINASEAPVKASGLVEVRMEQDITLTVETDPWYYLLVNDLDIEWSSTDQSVVTVDGNGHLAFKKAGTASIVARLKGTAYSTSVTLDVQDPFTVSGYSLTDYSGTSKVVHIPAGENIMTIGEEAFKNNTTVETIIIPKSVTTISQRAFYGCTNLKYVFIDGVTTQDVADSDLTLIEREAFAGCTSLEFVDFSNCKTFTVARSAFAGCTSLKFINGMENIGTAYDGAFADCSSLIGSPDGELSLIDTVTVLKENDDTPYTIENYADKAIREIASELGIEIDSGKITDISDITTLTITDITFKDGALEEVIAGITSLDLTGLHVSGSGVFSGCSSIKNITTGEFTAIGDRMFYGNKAFTSLTIETSSIGNYAFAENARLTSVTFRNVSSADIGNYAFSNSGNLASVTFENSTVRSIGNNAFERTDIREFTIPEGLRTLGGNIFFGAPISSVMLTTDITDVTFNGAAFGGLTVTADSDALSADEQGVIYNADKTKLLLAPSSVSAIIIPDTVREIGAYAFDSSQITAINIPASVTSIGGGAFENSRLANVTFADNSALVSIGERAFYGTELTSVALPSSVAEVGSYAFAGTPLADFTFAPASEATFGGYVFAYDTSLKTIALADNIKSMGDATFYGCTSLAEVTMPSVTSLGRYTFFNCLNLEKVTFGANATSTGTYTFVTYTVNTSTGEIAYSEYDKLKTVTLGGKMDEIGEATFLFCTALESIDIGSTALIGDLAFYGCSSLAEVKGLENAAEIGMYAFYNCKALTGLNLASAKKIGAAAFRMDFADGETRSSYTSINIPVVQSIGNFAFAGTSATQVTLPATLGDYDVSTVADGSSYTTSMGSGVFANAVNLTAIYVEEGSENYFSEGGVLYRTIKTEVKEYSDAADAVNGVKYSVGETGYELVAYPAGRTSASYRVKDGTVKIKAYAFAQLNGGAVSSVTLPYSVTVIGIGAFYESGITSFVFESVAAPTLESEYTREETTSVTTGASYYRGLYNTNFETDIIYYIPELYTGAAASSLRITYPSNGTGYDSYMYVKYFGTRTQSAAVLNETARLVKNNIESFAYTVEDINGWATIEVTDESKMMVTDFSDLVKETHRNYNLISSDAEQCALITQENIDKLFSIESALSAVKARFGIIVRITGTNYNDDYKSRYVEGETFDLTGLVITVTYDDYSTVSCSGDQLKLAETSAKPLTELDNVIVVEVPSLNQRVRIVVTVTAGEDGGDTPAPEGDGSATIIIVACSVGGAVAVIAAAVAIFFVIRKKKSAKPSDAAETDAANNTGDGN